MQLVNIETSVPSFYFETRPGVELQARRQWTHEWWEQRADGRTLVTSEWVLAELGRTPSPKRDECLGLLAAVPLLESVPEVDEIMAVYFQHKLVPLEAAGDAAHLAIASFHHCDILLTWNCKHLANANKFGHIRRVNGLLGLRTPDLVTPLELLGYENEN